MLDISSAPFSQNTNQIVRSFWEYVFLIRTEFVQFFFFVLQQENFLIIHDILDFFGERSFECRCEKKQKTRFQNE